MIDDIDDLDSRWRMISRDNDDVFGIIRGDADWLSTVKMPYIGGSLSVPDFYKYESCLFTKDGSEVLARYKTRAEAMVGHIELEEKFNLRRFFG